MTDISNYAINKSDLIANMYAKRPDLGELLVDESVREILEMMTKSLAQGDRIEIRGFGSFSLHHRKPRVGRNPKTGESVQVSAKAVPHFKPGKALRDAVNDAMKRTRG